MTLKGIVADKVCLSYPIAGVSCRSLRNRALFAATGGHISDGGKIALIDALRDLSFEVAEGDRLGLIGNNGAGKSTLLKVLSGIYQPTGGNLKVDGRVVSTLNLSLGMELEATGVENIISRGLLLGMKKKAILAKLDEICEFTELGEYLDMPVRVYSSGMLARLSFATVTTMNADVLLMDEVIGAGDASFIEKAQKRLNEFIYRSKIIVLASHDESMIRKFCNKAMVMERGSMSMLGSVDEAFDYYRQRNSTPN